MALPANHEIIDNTSQACKSYVWGHFGFARCKDTGKVTKDSVYCKKCHAKINYTQLTSNMRKHLEVRHDVMPASATRTQPSDLHAETGYDTGYDPDTAWPIPVRYRYQFFRYRFTTSIYIAHISS